MPTDPKRVQVFHHATGAEKSPGDFDSSTFEDPATLVPAGSALTLQFGTTAQRPALGGSDVGRVYFDTTILALLTWDGALWSEGLANNNGGITIRGFRTTFASSTKQQQREEQVDVRTPSNAGTALQTFGSAANRAYVVKGWERGVIGNFGGAPAGGWWMTDAQSDAYVVDTINACYGTAF